MGNKYVMSNLVYGRDNSSSRSENPFIYVALTLQYHRFHRFYRLRTVTVQRALC